MKRLFRLALLLALALVQPAFAQPRLVEAGDVLNFGTTFLGKKVQMVGRIDRAYGCNLPANRGNRCLEISDAKDPRKMDGALIQEGVYSFDQYKDWINNRRVLRFTGIVELRDGAGASYKENTKTPALIVQSIELNR